MVMTSSGGYGMGRLLVRQLPFSRSCGRRWREAPDEGLSAKPQRSGKSPHPNPSPARAGEGLRAQGSSGGSPAPTMFWSKSMFAPVISPDSSDAR